MCSATPKTCPLSCLWMDVHCASPPSNRFIRLSGEREREREKGRERGRERSKEMERGRGRERGEREGEGVRKGKVVVLAHALLIDCAARLPSLASGKARYSKDMTLYEKGQSFFSVIPFFTLPLE